MNVLQGVHKHGWQGLAIVLSSLSAGVPCFSGLGGCFICMWHSKQGMTRRDLYMNTPILIYRILLIGVET